MSQVADVINNTEAIMDLIASIKFIESRLDGYHSSQNKGKPVPKNTTRRHGEYESNTQTDTNNSSSEQDTLLGRNIDITV